MPNDVQKHKKVMVKHSFRELHAFLKASYSTQRKGSLPSGYIRDSELTGRRVQVYFSKKTQTAVVVHRGTQGIQDICSDVLFSFGNKKISRFLHSDQVQRLAESKYGCSNITTLGHSLGGAIAERVGKKSHKIITYNKAIGMGDIGRHIPENQIDIRTENDLVSALRSTQTGGKLITLPSRTSLPIEEHSLDLLQDIHGFV